ncbi:MAG: hypothetical protein IJ188_00480 [Clostridia bacterium]|nr:hypothetical protein [Clostridia bacterium]
MAIMTQEYKKPSMTNMPADVGNVIFAQILSTPVPDDELLEQRVREFEKKVKEARE